MNHQEDEIDPRMKLRLNDGDKVHALQLCRDLEIINERTLRELGHLPAGGLPVQVKRKPELPRGKAPVPPAVALQSIDTASESQDPDMLKLSRLLRRKEPRPAWPLWFDNYSFGADCYNTLRCGIVFARSQHVSTKVQQGPSGEPYRPDWKDKWSAGFSAGEDFARQGFPTPVEIRWTALDGVERKVEIDLESVFPGHLILHNVPQAEVNEDWMACEPHDTEILLEVNDQTINIYAKTRVRTKSPPNPDRPDISSRKELILAWTKTYPQGGRRE